MKSDRPQSLPSNTEAGSRHALKVLLIEDNPMDAQLLGRMLGGNGQKDFELRQAETLAAGLKAVQQSDLDVVLCDLSLPDSEGLWTFLRVQSQAPTLPIVVLSGTGSEDLAVRAVQRGAQDYLVKQQVEAGELVRAIRYAVERKRIEIALQQERDLFQMLHDNVPARIYIKDRQSRFVRVNREWATRFSLRDPSEAIGKTDFDFFAEDHARQAYEDEKRVMKTGKPILDLVEKETFVDRPPLWALTSKLPMRDKTGRITGTLGISHDITQLKTAEEKLTQANAALQRSHEQLREAHLQLIQAEKLQSVGRLAAGVAHEVKNPLAILQMCIDYLSSTMDISDRHLRDVMREMNEAIARADSIVRGLLDYSADRELDLKPHSVEAIVEKALMLLRHELGTKRIVPVKEFAPNLPPLLLDAEKIIQVLVNVLTNAVHAMARGGELRIRTSPRQMRPGDLPRDAGSRQVERLRDGSKAILLEVLDTGHGIPREKLNKVFDPFFTTKPTGQGTGLGLSVTKRIVEMHGGLIDVANQETGGVRVAITLAL